MNECTSYLARILAVVALSCAALHVVLLPLHTAGLIPTGAMLVLAVVCVRCAWHLWHAPAATTWLVVGGCAAAMLFLHQKVMATSGQDDAERGHEVAHSSAHESAAGDLLMTLATAFAVIEIALVLIGLSIMIGTRSQVQSSPHHPDR